MTEAKTEVPLWFHSMQFYILVFNIMLFSISFIFIIILFMLHDHVVRSLGYHPSICQCNLNLGPFTDSCGLCTWP